MFVRHVAADEPFPHDFCEGAKGVQLAELGLQSWAERRWLEVPDLEVSPAEVGAQHAAPPRRHGVRECRPPSASPALTARSSRPRCGTPPPGPPPPDRR